MPRLLGRLFDPSYRVTWIALLTAVLATLLAWRIVAAGVHNTAAQQFAELQTGFISELEKSIRANVEVLRGGAALLDTRPSTQRSEFRDYLQSIDVEERFPGLQGIGFAMMIAPGELAALEESLRGEGFPDFQVKPVGKRDIYSAIVFLEPFDWRNRRAFGFDMFQEPVRRAAMERARDTGEPAASGAVQLVQETDTDVQAGFLLYLPIYKTQGTPETIEERRAEIRGFVYSPFRIGNLVNALLEREKASLRRFAKILITTPGPNGNQERIFSSFANAPANFDGTGAFQATKLVDIHGAPWSIKLVSTPEFESSIDHTISWLTLAGGLLLSVMMAALLASSAKRHNEARRSNERMSLLTRELTHRVKNLLAVVQSISSRSLVDGRPLEEARDIFSRRLHALARAHTHLVDSSWRGVKIHELVDEELQAFGGQVSTGGPHISLNAGSAQTFVLIIHELATNASKYGALSVPSGHVAIKWRTQEINGQEMLVFSWKETGGPEVSEPTRRGFGQSLLRQSLAHGAPQPPQVEFNPNGLRYTFEVPLSGVIGRDETLD